MFSQVQHMEVTFLSQSEPRDTLAPVWWDPTTGRYLATHPTLRIILTLLQLAQTSALWTFWVQTELSFLKMCDICMFG